MADPATTLYLVRHGRTALNAAGLLRGHLDVPLDEVGRVEAERLGALFAGCPLVAVVSSPLSRALETAVPIARTTGALLEVGDNLIDRDYGPWAGRSRAEAEAGRGTLESAPGVEPLATFAARVTNALARLAKRASGGALAVVAHEAVNQVALARLIPALPDDPDRVPQRTGCWNRLEVTEGDWRAPVVDAVPGDGHRP